MASHLIFNLQKFKEREFQWRFSLLVLALFSGFTQLWGLANVERSEYYAAISKSMSLSFSNFIFGAMDPAGTITVDKIPASFWIPALLVKIFGFSTLAVTLPNALAGLAVTIFMTLVVKKYYGMTAGLIVGSIIATTPILVAVSRSNQPYPIYFLLIAIAIRYSIVALNESSTKDLIWAGFWIGIAFNSYMLLAWALWPPLILGYLFTNQRLQQKIRSLCIAGFVSFLVSGIWILLATLVPASKRPYLGGTNNNSALEIVFGYNGFGRFYKGDTQSESMLSRTFAPPFGGEPSPFRLFNVHLIGQISWLLPTAIFCLALLIFLKHKSPTFLFATSYLIIQLIIFSSVQGMHQFYVATIAFSIALIIMIGIQEFIKLRKPTFILAILGTTAIWAFFASFSTKQYFFFAPYFQLLILGLFIILSFKQFQKIPQLLTSILFVASLVLTPGLWSIGATQISNAINPMAGPSLEDLMIFKFQQDPNNLGGIVKKSENSETNESEYTELIEFVRSKTDSKFALATFTSLSAAPFINSTDELILPIGGFNGTDPSPTLMDFQNYVKNGDVQFVLREQNKRSVHVSSTTLEIRRWVDQNCEKAPYANPDFQLLDCK
jgi:4-amino-4-deoxy-L-arabinose transferase-like glycosyltransferase